MDRLGLLSGLAQGLNAGVESYQSAKQRALENKYKQASQQSTLLEKGQTQDEEGNVINDPNSTGKAAQEREQYGSGNDLAKGFAQTERGLIKQAGEDPNKILPPGFEDTHSKYQMEQITKPMHDRLNATINLQKMQALAAPKQDQVTQGASSAYDKNMGGFESQALQAGKIKHILESLRNVDPEARIKIMSTPAVKAELEAAQAGLFAQGKPTVHGMSSVQINTAYGNVQKGLGYIFSKPENLLNNDYLDQMLVDTDKLKEATAKQHEQKFQSFIARQPKSARNGLKESYNQARSQFMEEPEEQKGLVNQARPGDLGGAKAETPSGITGNEDISKMTPMQKAAYMDQLKKALGQ